MTDAVEDEVDPLPRVLPPLRHRLEASIDALSSALIRANEISHLFHYGSRQLDLQAESPSQQVFSPSLSNFTRPFDPPLRPVVSASSGIQSAGNESDAEEETGEDCQQIREESSCPLYFTNAGIQQSSSFDQTHLHLDVSFDTKLSPQTFLSSESTNKKNQRESRKGKEDSQNYQLSLAIVFTINAKEASKLSVPLLSTLYKDLRRIFYQSTSIVFNVSEELKALSGEDQFMEVVKHMWKRKLSARVRLEDVFAALPSVSNLQMHVYVVTAIVDASHERWETRIGTVDIDPEKCVSRADKNACGSSQFNESCHAYFPTQDVKDVKGIGLVSSATEKDDTGTHVKLRASGPQLLASLASIGRRHNGMILPDASEMLQGLEKCVQNMEEEVRLWKKEKAGAREKIAAMIESEEAMGCVVEMTSTLQQDEKARRNK